MANRLRSDRVARTTGVESLVDQLLAQVHAADTTKDGPAALRSAFTDFGGRAADSGIQLEEALAAAVSAYQLLTDRSPGSADDSATMLLAGIVLAATSEGFAHAHDARTPDGQNADDAHSARFAALKQSSRAATDRPTMGDVLDTAVRQIAMSTGAGACAVFLLDQATRTMTLRAAMGLNPAAVGSLVVGSEGGITGLAARERRLLVVSDAPHHPAWEATPEIGDEIYWTQVSVPMMALELDEPLGVLNVLYVERKEVDPPTLDYLQSVADDLATVILDAQLQTRTDEALRRKVSELGTLQHVSRMVASSLDLADVLEHVSMAAIELTRADAAAVFQLPGGQGVRDAEAAPEISSFTGRERVLLDGDRRNSLVSYVIQNSEARAADLRYADGESRLQCLPLRSARKTWGALCLRLAPGRQLDDEELGMVQAFTDSASIAIENAELYQEARLGFETASTLLQEMHHRVRNNLQTVAALLSLQLRQVQEPESADQLRDAVSRVQAIAAVHDLLSDESRLVAASISEVIKLVIDHQSSTVMPPELRVTFDVEPSDIAVGSRQATLLALVVNELLSNAIRHGFAGRKEGLVSVRIRQHPLGAMVEIENDGSQVPDGFDPATSSGLGMRIVHRLVTSDLNGEFRIRSSDNGTIASVAFPPVSNY